VKKVPVHFPHDKASGLRYEEPSREIESFHTNEAIMAKRVAVTTGNTLEGYEIEEYLGIVRGIVVRAQTIGQGIRGAFSSILGGNIRAYEEVCEQARSEAYSRMVEHGQERGADAIIAMRYDATEFAQGVTEVLAYGTAVKLRQPS
jgi:uncharacterized protein YbjQ (UPF0145 family)